MKKTLSVILIITMFLSLCVALSSCGGDDNPYQQYLKEYASGKTFNLSKEEGQYSSTTSPAAHLKRIGELRAGVNGNGKFYADIDDTEIVPRSNDDDTEDYRIRRGILLSYDRRDTVLKVFVFGYSYECVSAPKGEDSYQWTDGMSLNLSRTEMLTYEFDINKYFENGKLTAADAIGELKIDASKVSIDTVGMDSKKYTERNPEWETKVIDDVLDLVNDILGEIDAIVAEKIPA